MTYKVLIPEDVSNVGKEYLLERGYEIKMGSGIDEDSILRDIVDCDAILLRTSKITAKILEAGNKLKVIGRHGIGVDNIDLETATQLGIYVTNAPLSNANTVAECALGFIGALARKIVVIDKKFRNEGFEYRRMIPRIDELEGKILGLVGLGRIGSLVAKKASLGLGMNVVGYDPYVDPNNLDYPIEVTNDIDSVFKTGDFVSLHMPLTQETRGVIGIEKFLLMKPTAYFINTSRGEVVVENDLVSALKEQKIAGAALDVFQKEPLKEDNPLLSMDEVIISPHIASHSQESLDRMSLHAAMGIHEVLSGKKPVWSVNDPAV